MKKLKSYKGKSYSAFCIMLILILIHACAKPCDSKGLKALKAAEEGDLQGVKDYLENGGDPLYTCGESRSGSGLDYVESRLSDYILFLNLMKWSNIILPITFRQK